MITKYRFIFTKMRAQFNGKNSLIQNPLEIIRNKHIIFSKILVL